MAPAGRDALTTARERDRAYHQLVQFLSSWAHTMDRRDVLRVLGWAASTASLFPTIDLDEQQRVPSVLEAVLWRCRRQDYALGRRATRRRDCSVTPVISRRATARLG